MEDVGSEFDGFDAMLELQTTEKKRYLYCVFLL